MGAHLRSFEVSWHYVPSSASDGYNASVIRWSINDAQWTYKPHGSQSMVEAIRSYSTYTRRCASPSQHGLMEYFSPTTAAPRYHQRTWTSLSVVLDKDMQLGRMQVKSLAELSRLTRGHNGRLRWQQLTTEMCSGASGVMEICCDDPANEQLIIIIKTKRHSFICKKAPRCMARHHALTDLIDRIFICLCWHSSYQGTKWNIPYWRQTPWWDAKFISREHSRTPEA